MDHKEYLELKAKIEAYEKQQEFFLPRIKEYIEKQIKSKYKEILTNFDIKNEQNRQNKLIITVKFNVSNDYDYTIRQSFSKNTDSNLITKSLLNEIEEILNNLYIFYKLKQLFEHVEFSRNKSIITCRRHSKYKTLTVKINLFKHIVNYQGIYNMNDNSEVRLDRNIPIDPLRLCGNIGLGLFEQIEDDIKNIKIIKLNLR